MIPDIFLKAVVSIDLIVHLVEPQSEIHVSHCLLFVVMPQILAGQHMLNNRNSMNLAQKEMTHQETVHHS